MRRLATPAPIGGGAPDAERAGPEGWGKPQVPQILSISAVTLATRDMARAVRFYEALGFV